MYIEKEKKEKKRKKGMNGAQKHNFYTLLGIYAYVKGLLVVGWVLCGCVFVWAEEGAQGNNKGPPVV